LLPHRLTLLGEAMRPVLQNLETELDDSVEADTPVFDIAATVQHELAQLEKAVHRLAKRINDLMDDVASNEAASDSEVYRAASRFEAALQGILARYHGILSLDAYGTDIIVIDLLADVYRHSLIEIRDWLEELVETVADPMAAVRRRGLPTSGHVEIPLFLELTTAPELDELANWVELPSDYGASSSNRGSGLGFWGTVGAVVLGWGIGDALFGNDG